MRSRTWLVSIAVLVTTTVALIATGRLPFVTHAWDALTPSGAGSASSQSSDGGPGVDAGAGKKTRPQAAPLSSAQLGGPLVDGKYVTACGATADMKVVVKVTVKLGRATDVDVQTDPPDTAVSRCVQDAIESKRWDASSKTDHVTVRY